MLTHGDIFEIDGAELRLTIEDDLDSGPPWADSDCHGPVSEWTSRAKEPGELVLAGDGRGAHASHRYYDFAEAVKIAKRDKWGWIPGKLVIEPDNPPGGGGWARCDGFEAYDPDNFNTAITRLYQLVCAKLGNGEIASRAARSNYDYLRGWCNDEWHYVCVVVESKCKCCGTWGAHGESLCGIESDNDEYIDQLARDLGREIVRQLAEEQEEGQ